MSKSDPVSIFRSLGGKFASNLDDYASGKIGAHQIKCLLCGTAPCRCRPCPDCGWHGAPGDCQACR